MSQLVAVYTEELPPSFQWSPDDEFITGTTEFYIRTAEELSKLGLSVIVYYDGEAYMHNNISYLPRDTYSSCDILLACNSIPDIRGSKKNIFWNNLYHLRHSDCLGFDKYIVISEYHKKLFNLEKAYVIGHGVNDEDIAESPDKDPLLCIYTSSPDRGGDMLIGLWSIVNKETGARLECTYGNKTREEMLQLYRRAQFWIHPGRGIELFCISALRAQAARCYPIVVPNMALAETVKYGKFTSDDYIVSDIISTIREQPKSPIIDIPTWAGVTKELYEKVILD